MKQAGCCAPGDARWGGSRCTSLELNAPPYSLISGRSYLGHILTASILLIKHGWEVRD